MHIWYNRGMKEDIYTTDFSGVTHGRGYVYSLQYHIVWATKYRKPVIAGSVEADFKKDICEIAEDLGIGIIAMETMPDHIHMLVDCKPQLCISDAVKVLKGTSAWRLFRSHPEIKSQLWGGHLWNPSYFVATVSDRTREQVETYIREQRTKRGVGGRPRKKR